jgi:hypothetical protein
VADKEVFDRFARMVQLKGPAALPAHACTVLPLLVRASPPQRKRGASNGVAVRRQRR